ncbi:hypothetical protein, partial [uncultured Cloacibacillus sp.]|uniref:hypothetical protein n=1 Tax=uncultured Cloacibacillus sp. TaxID=889794 RepID=UPI00261B96E7
IHEKTPARLDNGHFISVKPLYLHKKSLFICMSIFARRREEFSKLSAEAASLHKICRFFAERAAYGHFTHCRVHFAPLPPFRAALHAPRRAMCYTDTCVT